MRPVTNLLGPSFECLCYYPQRAQVLMYPFHFFVTLPAPKSKEPTSTFHHPAPPRPSGFLSSVSAATSSSAHAIKPEIERTSSFSTAPAMPLRPASTASSSRKGKEREVDHDHGSRGIASGGGRAEDLTVVESLKMGPREFGNGPGGDAGWERVEPNSGIRLSCVQRRGR